MMSLDSATRYLGCHAVSMRLTHEESLGTAKLTALISDVTDPNIFCLDVSATSIRAGVDQVLLPCEIDTDSAETKWIRGRKMLRLTASCTGSAPHASANEAELVCISVRQALSGTLVTKVQMRLSEDVSRLQQVVAAALGYPVFLLSDTQFLQPNNTLLDAGIHDDITLSAIQERDADITIQLSEDGLSDAKDVANSLFSIEDYEGAARWFSKAIWLIDTGIIRDVPVRLSSILRSNRAWAYIKLDQFQLAEEDCSRALDIDESNVKALYRRALARLGRGAGELALSDVNASLETDKIKGKRSAEPAEELKLRIASAMAAGICQEDFPDLHVEASDGGIEVAKSTAKRLFGQGAFRESARFFSKCLSFVRAERIALNNVRHSILHSNRALAYIKLRRWTEVVEDCSAALRLMPGNVKANYRRALALFELEQFEAALGDIEHAVPLLPDGASRREAAELKENIELAMRALASQDR